MSRLIDADKQEKIIEELENICINAPEYVKDLLAELKNQPTVFDTEQMKAEIQQMKENAEVQYGHQLGFDKIYAYENVLQIIDKHMKGDTDD